AVEVDRDRLTRRLAVGARGIVDVRLEQLHRRVRVVLRVDLRGLLGVPRAVGAVELRGRITDAGAPEDVDEHRLVDRVDETLADADVVYRRHDRVEDRSTRAGSLVLVQHDLVGPRVAGVADRRL